MTESNIVYMMHLMGVENCSVVSKGQNVKSSCPYSRWLHQSGTDKHPSFSILINNSGKSVGNCFSCKKAGSMLHLAYSYGKYTYAEDVIKFVRENEIGLEEKKDDIYHFGKKLTWEKSKWFPVEVGKKEFDEDKVEVIEWRQVSKYLKSIPQYVINRGILKETAKIWKLGYNKSFLRVFIPVIDRRQRLVGYGQRAIRDDGLPKYLYNKGFRKECFLYGENLFDFDKSKDLILVEGHFDTWKVYQAGFNVGGLLGSSLSNIQRMKIIEKLPKDGRVILMFDGDIAGEQATEVIYEKLKNDVYCIKRRVLDEKDPCDLTERQIRELVMINECK